MVITLCGWFQPRPPPLAAETGLGFDDDKENKKRQQLNADRQREYNELLAKVGNELSYFAPILVQVTNLFATRSHLVVYCRVFLRL